MYCNKYDIDAFFTRTRQTETAKTIANNERKLNCFPCTTMRFHSANGRRGGHRRYDANHAETKIQFTKSTQSESLSVTCAAASRCWADDGENATNQYCNGNSPNK